MATWDELRYNLVMLLAEAGDPARSDFWARLEASWSPATVELLRELPKVGADRGASPQLVVASGKEFVIDLQERDFLPGKSSPAPSEVRVESDSATIEALVNDQARTVDSHAGAEDRSVLAVAPERTRDLRLTFVGGGAAPPFSGAFTMANARVVQLFRERIWEGVRLLENEEDTGKRTYSSHML